jgi:hypothetical protein
MTALDGQVKGNPYERISIMHKELSDHEAAELWRQLSKLVGEVRKLTFMHESASDTTTTKLTCELFSWPVERHLFRKSCVNKRWVSSGDSMLECLKGVLDQRERSRVKYRRTAPPATDEEEEGDPDE